MTFQIYAKIYARNKLFAHCRKMKKTNRYQFKEMISVMKNYPDIARNRTKRKPEEISEFWEKLQMKLNNLGPPEKEVVEWKKVWTDHKSYLKRKLIAQKKEKNVTCGGISKKVCFTADEDEVIQLVDLSESVDGIPKASAFAVSNDEDESSEDGKETVECERSPSPASTELFHKSPKVARNTPSLTKPKDVFFISKQLGKTDTLQTFTIPISNLPFQPALELPPHSQSRQSSKPTENLLADTEKQTYCRCLCPSVMKNNVNEFEILAKAWASELQKLSSAKLIMKNNVNELEILAKAWAWELQKMSPAQQIHAKRAIAEVIYQGQLGLLNAEMSRTKPSEREKNLGKEADPFMEIEKEKSKYI